MTNPICDYCNEWTSEGIFVNDKELACPSCVERFDNALFALQKHLRYGQDLDSLLDELRYYNAPRQT